MNQSENLITRFENEKRRAEDDLKMAHARVSRREAIGTPETDKFLCGDRYAVKLLEAKIEALDIKIQDIREGIEKDKELAKKQPPAPGVSNNLSYRVDHF